MDYSRLGRVIRLRRLTLGLSQAELAIRAGIDRTYVSDVEAGTRNLSLGVTKRLADALGVGMIQLLQEAFEAN
jgi:transcriptional regulator with XRE-family HTH domain